MSNNKVHPSTEASLAAIKKSARARIAEKKTFDLTEGMFGGFFGLFVGLFTCWCCCCFGCGTCCVDEDEIQKERYFREDVAKLHQSGNNTDL